MLVRSHGPSIPPLLTAVRKTKDSGLLLFVLLALTRQLATADRLLWPVTSRTPVMMACHKCGLLQSAEHILRCRSSLLHIRTLRQEVHRRVQLLAAAPLASSLLPPSVRAVLRAAPHGLRWYDQPLLLLRPVISAVTSTRVLPYAGTWHELTHMTGTLDPLASCHLASTQSSLRLLRPTSGKVCTRLCSANPRDSSSSSSSLFSVSPKRPTRPGAPLVLPDTRQDIHIMQCPGYRSLGWACCQGPLTFSARARSRTFVASQWPSYRVLQWACCQDRLARSACAQLRTLVHCRDRLHRRHRRQPHHQLHPL
jgi:hypothetical protein